MEKHFNYIWYMKLRTRKTGSTLVELLVVIGIIVVLAGLLLPALTKAREKYKRIACMNNISQLTKSILIYAEDDARGSLSGKSDFEDQDLNWLANGYAEDRRLYICPSTANIISTNRDLHPLSKIEGYTDLRDISHDTGPVKGSSYQPMGFMGEDVDVWYDIPFYGKTKRINGVRKDLKNIHTYAHYHNSFGLKGVVTGPSRIWIIGDQGIIGKLYWPDRKDNHGESGVNMGYCDGHVEWVRRENYIYKYEMSQDEGRTDIEIPWL